jgi:myxalamid-type polyketide synthase MxaE and MxaD
LETLGALFEAGAPIDLARLAGPARRHPVSLPGYPYQRRELWIEPPSLLAGQEVASEPLAFSLEGCPSIRDHRVHGTPFAPAALLFDRALVAVSPAHAGGALEDVVIGRPLVLEAGTARRGRVREVERDGRASLVLETRLVGDDDGEWIEHLAAHYVPRRRSQDRRAEAWDLDAVRGRCTDSLPVDALYARLAAGGLSYGPSVRTLRAVWRGDQEVLARLEPQDAAGQAGAPHRLHPGIVDGAMQAIAGLTVGVGLRGTPTFLGFAVRRIAVQAAVRGACYVHARLLSELHPDCEAIRADVVLLDDQGLVLTSFDEVSLKRFHGRGLLGGPAYVYGVRSESLEPLGGRRLTPNARVLVLGPPGGLRTALVRELETQGAIAFPGTGPLGAGALRPLRGDGPKAVLSLEPRLDDLGDAARALAEAGVDELLGWLSIGGEAGVEGFVRSLDRERPGWGVGHVRVCAPLSPSEVARAAALELAGGRERTTLELLAESGRRAPQLVPLEAEAPAGRELLRPRGVYWITGGMGGLGLAVAEALAARVGARLLLTGRRTVPDPAALARLEQVGGEALYVPADVTDREAMRRALRVAQDAWGEVHGVIHAAGVLADAALEERTPEQRQRVWAPKVDGARTLLEVSRGEDLDLVCLFSSISALYGVAGQTDYAAANAALDELARGHRGGHARVLSLAWGPWREVGMVRDEGYQAAFRAQGLRAFTPLAGGEAFLRALEVAEATPDRHLVVVDVDPSRESTLRQALGQPAAGRQRSTPRAQGGEGGPWKRFLRQRLAARLHRDPVEVDPAASFHELGVDSLMAVGLVRELERRFEVRLYPTLLFEHPTLDALAAHLADAHPIDEAPAAAPPAPQEPVRETDCEAYQASPGEGVQRTRIALAAAGPGEVIIDVKASGVNFIDLLAGVGMHPTLGAARFVPGHEVAGVVSQVGEGVEGFSVGDRVLALIPSGGYAARAVAPAATTRRLPDGMSFSDGAAIVVTGLTAVACVELKGRVVPGERVLIQAAAGATGLACVQLALHHGAEVLGTASAPAKLARLREMGVAHAIDYRAEPFDEAVRRITHGDGVDVIVDSLSGDAITRGLAVLRPGGRFVEIGAAGVVAPPPVDPKALFLADQDFSTVNVARLHSSPQRLAASFERLLHLLDEGVISAQVGHVLPFREVDEAHRLLRERRNLGKVVLEL